MAEEMKELYTEGVATHDGRGSCVVREDDGEALTAAAGLDVSHRLDRVREVAREDKDARFTARTGG